MKLEDNPRMICLPFYFLPSHRSELTSPLEVMVGRDDKQSAGPRIGRDDKQNTDDMGCCFSSGQQLSRMKGHSLAPVVLEQVCPSLLALTGSVVVILDMWPCPTGGWAPLLGCLRLCLGVLYLFGVLTV